MVLCFLGHIDTTLQPLLACLRGLTNDYLVRTGNELALRYGWRFLGRY